jgi:hypothetical protein
MFCGRAVRWYRDTGAIAFRTRLCSISTHAAAPPRLRAQQRSAMIGIGDWWGSRTGSFNMNYRLLALAITAFSSAHITTAAAQSVYVAPGGVYIGGGPVYVIPAPSNGNGNGTYVEPTYGYGYGVPEPTPYVAPTVVAPGVGYGAAPPYGLNGNGYGYGYRNGPPPPAYYNGDPVLSAYGRARLYNSEPRPPAAIPYNGDGRCIASRGYGIGRCY